MRRPIIFTLFILCLFWPWPLSAHQVNRAAEFGVIVHVEPDDTPRVGESSRIFVEIGTGTDGRQFPVGECDCWLLIKKSGDDGYSAGRPFTMGDAFSPVDYVFDQPGRYDLRVSAIPLEYLENPSFDSFTADFEVEVKNPPNTYVLAAAYAAAALAALGLAVWVGLKLKRALTGKNSQ